MAENKGRMRGVMPVTAAWVDRMRLAFGAEHIDGQIRKGMRGETTFWASENGHAVGTKGEEGWRVIKDARGNRTVAVDGNGKRWRYEDGQYRPETEAERDQ